VIEQRSHKEIAQMLGIKETTSASQFYHAKQMLMKMIEEYKQKQ
jgi:RNA polymerase sigma-70 factor (ECF subfamily)